MTQYTATVAASGTTSGWINILADVAPNGLTSIVTPSALTSTSLTIQVSLDGSTALTLYDFTGSTFTIPCVANAWIALDPALFLAFPWVRIVTGSSEAAARDFKLVIRGVS
jgi:hypothetical protein